MNVNDQLTVFVSQLNMLDAPFTQDELDDAIAKMGSFPSLEMLEKLLQYFKDKKNNIERNDIPCALAEAGLRDATMEDGTKVSVAQFYETKQGDKNELALWLENNGYGDIIKDTIAFSKGSVDEELLRFLREREYAYSRDSTINSQTLKKVLKDHVAAGGELPPEEAVKVSIFTSAVVKRPKEEF